MFEIRRCRANVMSFMMRYNRPFKSEKGVKYTCISRFTSWSAPLWKLNQFIVPSKTMDFCFIILLIKGLDIDDNSSFSIRRNSPLE